MPLTVYAAETQNLPLTLAKLPASQYMQMEELVISTSSASG